MDMLKENLKNRIKKHQKIVKVWLHFSRTVEISIQFDEFSSKIVTKMATTLPPWVSIHSPRFARA